MKTVKELHKLLGEMLKKYPECSELPVRIHQEVPYLILDENYWLSDVELHRTGQSGYELNGELTLISEV